MTSPVRGLRPERAARWPTLNVPKPTSVTLWFFFSVVLTASIIASRDRAAAALEISADFAICSTSSDLFTQFPLKNYVELTKNFLKRTLNAYTIKLSRKICSVENKSGYQYICYGTDLQCPFYAYLSQNGEKKTGNLFFSYGRQ